ncbi:hypothetical protein ACM66B_000250 [Microbotryomycetes sp. NB124-2]
MSVALVLLAAFNTLRQFYNDSLLTVGQETPQLAAAVNPVQISDAHGSTTLAVTSSVRASAPDLAHSAASASIQQPAVAIEAQRDLQDLEVPRTRRRAASVASRTSTSSARSLRHSSKALEASPVITLSSSSFDLFVGPNTTECATSARLDVSGGAPPASRERLHRVVSAPAKLKRKPSVQPLTSSHLANVPAASPRLRAADQLRSLAGGSSRA